MEHSEKITWMREWAKRNGCTLELAGECGFGRECVGVLRDGSYPDYGPDFESIDISDDAAFDAMQKAKDDEDVWTPPDAYHKHDCVAVLGRGDEPEAQLYDWLRWFDERDYTVKSEPKKMDPRLGMIGLMLGKNRRVFMAKK